MDNANQHPANGSHRSSSPAADKEKVSSTLTQAEEIQRPNELFWEFAYRNEVPRLTDKINQLCQENNQLRGEKLVLEFQNIQLKAGKQNGGFDDDIARKRNDGFEAPNQKTREMISSLGKQPECDHKEKQAHEIAKPKSTHDDWQPLVIKKLQYKENQNAWLGYVTMDEDEKPKIISIVNSDLVIDGIVTSKKLIIDGVFTQYESDPFLFHHIGESNGRFDVSHMLKKVLSCKITDFFLFSQDLVWKEFEKLVSSKTIKRLYFANNQIIDEKKYLVSIEKILEYAPNIESVVYYDEINKETFVKLLESPVFAKLREFVTYNISFHDFDAQSFLAFMKKHPNAHFTLKFLRESPFYVCSEYDKAEYQKMKRMLESRAPKGKLLIESL